MSTKKIIDLNTVTSVTDGLYFPSDDGIQSYRASAAQILTYIGSGFRSLTGAVAKSNVTAVKVTTYGIGTTDDVIPCDTTGGGFTVTLPTAVGAGGRIYTIHKIIGDTSNNALTIATTSSQTIDGATTRIMYTAGEMVRVVSNGVGWLIIGRKTDTQWSQYAMTIGAQTTPPTKGTHPVDQAFWRRNAGDMEIYYEYGQTGAGSAGSGIYLFPIPFGTMDNTLMTVGGATLSICRGPAHIFGASSWAGFVSIWDTTNMYLEANVAGFVGSSTAPLSSATIRYSFMAKVPMVGWNW